MTVNEYLVQHPIHFPATVADVRKAYKAAGGEPLSRSAFLVEVGNFGHRIERPRGRWVILPKPSNCYRTGAPGEPMIRPDYIGQHLRP